VNTIYSLASFSQIARILTMIMVTAVVSLVEPAGTEARELCRPKGMNKRIPHNVVLQNPSSAATPVTKSTQSPKDGSVSLDDKTIEILIVGDNEQPLNKVKVDFVPKCCNQCKLINKPCEDCCAPGFTDLSTTTTSAGTFDVDSKKLRPGDYTIKVERGRLTKDIDIRVREGGDIQLIKGERVKLGDDSMVLQLVFAGVEKGAP
jgi:hypothetical protein